MFAARPCPLRFALDTYTHGITTTSAYIGRRVIPASVCGFAHFEELQRRRHPSPPTAASLASASALAPWPRVCPLRLPHQVHSSSQTRVLVPPIINICGWCHTHTLVFDLHDMQRRRTPESSAAFAARPSRSRGRCLEGTSSHRRSRSRLPCAGCAAC